MTVVAGLVMTPELAHGFECTRVSARNATNIAWPERRVPWVLDRQVIDALGPFAQQEVERSFAEWTSVTCSDLTFEFQGVIDGVRAGYDDGGPNTNAVVWVGDNWPHARGAIAVTTSSYQSRSGRLLDADIELNGEHFDFVRVDATCNPRSNTMDLRNTLTHEVGHVVGLEHPPERPEFQRSTMFASAPSCETIKRTLAADDRDGICFIYPRGAANQRCPTPPGFGEDEDSGCAHSASRRGEGGYAWLCLVLAAVVLRLRTSC